MYLDQTLKINKNFSNQDQFIEIENMSRRLTKPTTCLPSEHSDQPGHPPSLIRVCAGPYMGNREVNDPMLPHAYSEDSDQTRQLAMLI